MNKVLCGFVVLNMLLATQSYASGCDTYVTAEPGLKISEVSVTGMATCYGPAAHANFYRCEFIHNEQNIPKLDQYYVEPEKRPTTGVPIQAIVEIYQALLSNECNGPEAGSPPNGYYYKVMLNGVEYFNYEYYK